MKLVEVGLHSLNSMQLERGLRICFKNMNHRLSNICRSLDICVSLKRNKFRPKETDSGSLWTKPLNIPLHTIFSINEIKPPEHCFINKCRSNLYNTFMWYNIYVPNLALKPLFDMADAKIALTLPLSPAEKLRVPNNIA